jgi:gas vesicle protein
MIKKLVAMNLKQVQIAFFAGSTVGCIFGTFAGVGLGVALGLVLAPKSGRELRHDLKDKTITLAGKVKEGSLKLKDNAQSLYSDMSQRLAS